MRKNRTKQQNEELVIQICNLLIKYKSYKQVAYYLNIKLSTMSSLLKRYRIRYGFHNMYHMIVILTLKGLISDKSV